jgi:2-polyprenyl-3-methyl-5-hydroxy-6-metoxy-1,4-benzoquinol methylase
MEIENYAKKHRNRTYVEKIIDEEIITLLENGANTVVEIGCGDGALAYTMLRDFECVSDFYAYDISDLRLTRLSEICSDHLNSQRLRFYSDFDELKSAMTTSADLVVSEQVIEHVDGEEEFLRNIHRLCDDNTIVYLSTVFINGPAYYYYKNKAGKRVLDPTHVREYSNQDLIKKIRHSGFDLIYEKKRKMFYPLSSFINKCSRTFGFEIFRTSRFWIRLPFYYHWRLSFKKRRDH